MKKILVGFLLILFLLVASVFIFIPNSISINHSVVLNITQEALYRTLVNNKDWSHWWPGNSHTGNSINNTILEYKDHQYNITGRDFGQMLISISGTNFSAKTSLISIPLKADSLKLSWTSVIPTSYNPVKRLQVYLGFKQLDKNITAILEKMKAYFDNQQHTYGMQIHNELVEYPLLISTFVELKNYPSIDEVYAQIDKLQKHIDSQSGKSVGYPMLNIFQKDSATWVLKVAIPTDKELRSAGDISVKRMLGGGKILMTEIKGGPATIKNAHQQMEHYVNDHHYSTPAIPYESLVTDRRIQQDTAQWITRIYFPVI